MRPISFLFAIATLSFAAVTACGESRWDDNHYGDSQNEILFGISQHVDPASGKKQVSAGYEFLGLAHQGGWNAAVFKDGDGEGTCYFERYDNRLGRERVESGVATFGGGKLPGAGLQILANQPSTIADDTGWSTDDLLTFDVSGFAMPPIHPATMNAPAADLTITNIAPAPSSTDVNNATFALTPTSDIDVTWTSVTEKVPTRVMVSLETDEPRGGVAAAPAPATTDAGTSDSSVADAAAPPTTTTTDDVPSGNVRCFSSAKNGHALIPHEWVARLFSSVAPNAPIKGHLEISTHRQLTIQARASWTVYVVATTQHRSVSFTGTR